MARLCCTQVWNCEQDLKLLAHEEINFNNIHAEFVKRADAFKVLAKRVYKSLNVLWYSGKGMGDRDSRKVKCLDTVTKISCYWMYNDQVLRKEMEVSSSYPDGLRLVLLKIMARVSAIDAQLHCNMIWDADCLEKISRAFKEIIPRAHRLLDGEWMSWYCFYFGKANNILSDSEKQIDAFFLQTFGCTPEDLSIDSNTQRDSAKPPHEAAFGYVAQIISSRFMDADRAPPEVLDLRFTKPESVSTVEGNPAEVGSPSHDKLPPPLEKEAADATDNVALTIERVVAGCNPSDEPECIDLTDSPPQGNLAAAPPGSRRKRQVVQGGGTQPTIVQLVPMGQTKAPSAKGVVKISLNLSTKTANSATPGLPIADAEATVATPTSKGVADVPTEAVRATVAAPVRHPIVQRFLYVRSQKQNVEAGELAANKLRLGFGGEGAANCKGALFQRFYRPDGPGEHQRKQFDTLLPERANGEGTNGTESVANGASSSCGLKPSGKCIGHVVHLNSQTGATKTVESSTEANADMKKKFISPTLSEPVKPGKVNEAVNKTSAFKFTGNVAARRRFVANGRKPFIEIRPALSETEDAGKPRDAARSQSSVGGIRVSKTSLRFKPYKLELHGGDAVLGKATVTGGGVQGTATKKYDFRSRVRDGRERSDGKMEELGLSQPTIKMRKDLFSKQEAPK